MNDKRSYGLNRTERRTHPGAVPTTIVQPDSPSYLSPAPPPAVSRTGAPAYWDEHRTVNGSKITVRTYVHVIPGERPAATDGYTPMGRKANWRDYQRR